MIGVSEKGLLFLGFFFMSCGGGMPSDVAIAYDALPEEIDFNFHVRPILSDKCYACHGPDEHARKGDLRLDMEEAAFAELGDGQVPFYPGDPSNSVAMQRVLSTDHEIAMPPVESNLKLTAEEKAIIYKWIEDGAEWKKHWSFIAPEKKQVPSLESNAWAQNEIDYFIQKEQGWRGLKPSPQATKEELIRRLSFDLTGLPPSLSEIDHYLNDESSDSYEQLVDRLLASPAYGERWCWDWLDLARYADTNGFQNDPVRKMWPWRDWVIKAFNENMPFDQFSIEQLAGDLIPNATQDQILATAFNRNHMYNGEGGRHPEETRVENVLDRVETFGTVWLGLTFNCCRCHDHKFDPLAQKEYYQLYDYFNQTTEEGMGRNGRVEPVLDLSNELGREDVQKIEAFITEKAEVVEAMEKVKFPRAEGLPAAESDSAKHMTGDELFGLGFSAQERSLYYVKLLGYQYKSKDPDYYKAIMALRGAKEERERITADNLQVMVMDQISRPRQSYVLSKGNYASRGEEVSAGTPAALPSLIKGEENNRLALARWLFRDDHPLTSRVTVNRFWQAVFGKGLVKTSEDFGVQGSRPTHPELLDWLAVDFKESGWDVKQLLKKMVMSATYQQQAKVSPEDLEKDPENLYYARSSRYRWPSWMLRDQALALSGLINDSIGGPAMKPYQPPGIWEEATFGFSKYVQDHGNDLYRRTLYVFWRRIVGPTMLFDNAARQFCEVTPLRTNTPLHALTSLNDITYVEAARVLAERVMTEKESERARVDYAFRLATSRFPRDKERAVLIERLDHLKEQFGRQSDEAAALINIGEYRQNDELDKSEQAAYTALCSVILNLDEVMTKQ